MIAPDIDLSPEQEAEVWRAIEGLPHPVAWAVLKNTADLLRPKKEISTTDVRHAIAAAFVKTKVRPRVVA